MLFVMQPYTCVCVFVVVYHIRRHIIEYLQTALYSKRQPINILLLHGVYLVLLHSFLKANHNVSFASLFLLLSSIFILSFPLPHHHGGKQLRTHTNQPTNEQNTNSIANNNQQQPHIPSYPPPHARTNATHATHARTLGLLRWLCDALHSYFMCDCGNDGDDDGDGGGCICRW